MPLEVDDPLDGAMMCHKPRCVFAGYFNTFARMLNRWYHCWLAVLGFHNGLSARDGGFASQRIGQKHVWEGQNSKWSPFVPIVV